MTDNSIKELSAGIINQAIDDYTKVVKNALYGNIEKVSMYSLGLYHEAVLFFKSSWYEMLSSYNTENTIEQIDKILVSQVLKEKDSVVIPFINKIKKCSDGIITVKKKNKIRISAILHYLGKKIMNIIPCRGNMYKVSFI